MRFKRVLHVAQQHSLGFQEAKTRLKTLMGGDGLFTLIEKHWDESTGIFTFSAAVSIITVRGTVKVAETVVELTTEKLPLVAVPFIASEQARIQSKLAEILKP